MNIPKRIREQKKMKAYELAKKVGVVPSYITKIVRHGQVPSPDIARKIALVLGDDPQEYVNWAISHRIKDAEAKKQFLRPHVIEYSVGVAKSLSDIINLMRLNTRKYVTITQDGEQLPEIEVTMFAQKNIHLKDSFAMKITGSYLKPVIENGQTAIVFYSQNIEDFAAGDYAIIALEEGRDAELPGGHKIKDPQQLEPRLYKIKKISDQGNEIEVEEVQEKKRSYTFRKEEIDFPMIRIMGILF